MNITIIAAGSRGDVQPYIALGSGLKAAGHRVQILASTDFSELVATYGLEFTAISENTEAAAQHMAALAEQGNIFKILAGTGRGAQKLAIQSAAIGLAACQHADVIVAGLGGLFIGLALAEKLAIPFIPAHLLPFTPTRAFPSAVLPLPQTRYSAWANKLSHHVTHRVVWQMFRAADTEARRRVLRLAPAPFWGPFTQLQQSRPVLYGYSPHVLPQPTDWPRDVHVVGYWQLGTPANWQPPADLLAFLNAGPPPVYVGFGSMPSRDPAANTRLVLQALAQAGQRGVLYAGWGGLQQSQLPPDVFLTQSVPHSWLFPHMAAVIHHGGAGTTGAGLQAGVPSIVVPFFGDQPFWGQRVHALGVGPRPIPRRKLTADNLSEAIRRSVSDEAMRKRAAQLGQRIRADDGVAYAAKVITQAGMRR